MTLVDDSVAAKIKRSNRIAMRINNPVEVATIVDGDVEHKALSKDEPRAAHEETLDAVLESNEPRQQAKAGAEKANTRTRATPESTRRSRQPQPAISASTPVKRSRKRKTPSGNASDDEPLFVAGPSSLINDSEAPSQAPSQPPSRRKRPLRSSSPVVDVHDPSDVPVLSSDVFNPSPTNSRFTKSSVRNRDGGKDVVIMSTPQANVRKRKSAALDDVFADAPAIPPPTHENEASRAEKTLARARSTKNGKPELMVADTSPPATVADDRPSKRTRFDVAPATHRKPLPAESRKPILRAPKLPTTYGTVHSVSEGAPSQLTPQILKELTEVRQFDRVTGKLTTAAGVGDQPQDRGAEPRAAEGPSTRRVECA